MNSQKEPKFDIVTDVLDPAPADEHHAVVNLLEAAHRMARDNKCLAAVVLILTEIDDPEEVGIECGMAGFYGDVQHLLDSGNTMLKQVVAADSVPGSTSIN